MSLLWASLKFGRLSSILLTVIRLLLKFYCLRGCCNTIVDNENDKDNTLCIALLYRYRTHICTIFSNALIFLLKLLADF